MSRLNLKAVEERVRPLAGREHYDRGFVFELLEAYGRSKSTVARLRSGNLNVADDPATQVAQKGVVYFAATDADPLPVIDALRTSPTVVRYSTRFVIVTDFETLLAVDTKTGETLSTPICEIDRHFTFFLPWAGMEKAQVIAEAHADVKAAEKMARLFDELLAANPGLQQTPEQRHALNVFFTRLLFCFFAEDTCVFADSQFTDAVASLTQVDGSDTQDFLTDLFAALDTEAVEARPHHLAAFPYVNGSLFRVGADQVVPVFGGKARDLLLEMGRLRWDQINPDIFGSMFQAVVTPGQRSDLGQHYTSVPNILKTIEPLFLDDLKEQLSAGYDSVKKLEALHTRIADIRIFDPACGSGNFLVIAYKELRRIEHAILERIGDLKHHHVLFAESRITIEHFYGIEIDDFAVEVAILSLWIAKHQMNREAGEKFDVELPLIPLKESGRIVHGNAARLDWKEVCPNNGVQEIYLISNPPYAGSKKQTAAQKSDFATFFQGKKYPKDLDYVSLWFLAATEYMADTRVRVAFVSTNSVSQGEHVALLFRPIFAAGVEIAFAHVAFKWINMASRRAGVTVVVIGLRPRCAENKYLYSDDRRARVENINGYLVAGDNIFIDSRRKSLNTLPPILNGSMPNDRGNLLLKPAAKDDLLRTDPLSSALIRKFTGTEEYIDGLEKFALWIDLSNEFFARGLPGVARRIDAVEDHRRASRRPATNRVANVPWRFAEVRHREALALFIPRHSSENRRYLPIGFLGADYVIGDSASAIYDASPWVFSLLASGLHLAWTKAVGGQLETRIRYSNEIVYNNFPVPPISDADKERMTVAALRILDVREYHSEQTLAQLYDPDKMSADLRLAHQQNDDLVDSLYRASGFESDEDRLSHLFAMYEDMTKHEQRT